MGGSRRPSESGHLGGLMVLGPALGMCPDRLLPVSIPSRLEPGQGWECPACCLHCPPHPGPPLPLQPAEPVKRQPRSQCLSTLVRPVFGEVRMGLGLGLESRQGQGCDAVPRRCPPHSAVGQFQLLGFLQLIMGWVF